MAQPTSLTVTFDSQRYGSLVRVARDSQCGYLHISELAHLIRQFLTRSGSTISTPISWVDLLLAKGIAIGMMVGRTDVKMILSFDRREIPLRYGITDLGPISIPPTLWILRFTEGRMTTARLFASPVRIMALTDPHTIYAWPYGNVHGDGAICWGSLTNIRVLSTNPSEVDHLFFSSPFNADLIRAHTSSSGLAFRSLSQFAEGWKIKRAERTAAKVPIGVYESNPRLEFTAGSAIPVVATTIQDLLTRV